MRLGVLALALALPLMMSGEPQQAKDQGVPDAPLPQNSGGLGALAAGVAPGEGAQPAPDPYTPPPASQPPSATPDQVQTTPPEVPKPGQARKGLLTFSAHVTAVTLPVTVLDSKHHEVAGLDWRDFRVYEDNQLQHISWFSDDAMPLSVALVIDQSLTQDVMEKVNNSLSAIQGAFTPVDEVAVFTYSNGVNNETTFTAATGARLPAVLEASRRPGADMGVPINSGPFAGGPRINGRYVDPNLEPGRSASGPFIVIPKEVHTLNDAILAAGKALSTRPKGSRRIIYVISDGRESRSKASYKDVVRYLQANEIAVYGTLVGDSAVWGLGYLDKIKLPLLPLSPDNILPRYVDATGGHLESEFSENGIQRSFAELAALGRTQYTIGYYSHIPLLDSSFRTIRVDVMRPNLDVRTKKGYYPTATALTQ